MNYYHGSPVLFDRFDFSKSKSSFENIHLTPNIDYAKHFAIKENGIGYLYTIRIKSEDPNLEYKEGMSNMSVRSDNDLEIIDIEKIQNLDKK